MYRPRPLRAIAALLASLIVGVRGDCDCYGLDYTNGGSYLIDGNSETKFSFTSQFEGTCPSSRGSRFRIGRLHTKTGSCFDASIVPILISPEGYGYQCSPIESNLDNVEQVSTWCVETTCL